MAAYSTALAREFSIKLLLTSLFLLLGVLIYSLRQLILLTFLSIILAVFWDYVASGLQNVSRHKLSRVPAVFMAIGLSLGSLGILGFFLFEPLQEQFQAFVTESPRIARDAWMKLQPILRRFGLHEFNPESLNLGGVPGGIVQSGMQILGAGVTTLISLVAVLFLAVFWALNPDGYRRGFLRLLPQKYEPRAATLLDQLSKTFRMWMKATGLSMVAISLLTSILLWVAGIPYFLLFGLAAGLFDIIPFLGPILAFTGPFLLALSISLTKTLWVIAGYLVIQTIEGNIIVPYFLKREVALPPALTVFTIFAMGELFGVLGVFLAAPTLAAIIVFVKASRGLPVLPDAEPEASKKE